MGDEKLLKEIGARINTRRKELGLTQEELAEKMDVSVQMISNLELGKKAIRPENLAKVCTILNISADYILRGVFSDREATELSDKLSKLSLEDRKMIETFVDRLIRY